MELIHKLYMYFYIHLFLALSIAISIILPFLHIVFSSFHNILVFHIVSFGDSRIILNYLYIK